jgi:hypothetical protein
MKDAEIISKTTKARSSSTSVGSWTSCNKILKIVFGRTLSNVTSPNRGGQLPGEVLNPHPEIARARGSPGKDMGLQCEAAFRLPELPP